MPETPRKAINKNGLAVRRAVLNWTASHLRDYPWREAGRSPYEVLVAELLLKRTTATAASRIYVDFLSKFPSLEALVNSPQEDFAEALSTVGLQWQRASAIKALALYLMEKEGGEIPSTLQRLLLVPGIGDYSARAILSFGLGIPAAVVDANIERVLSRVFQNALPPRPNYSLLQNVVDALLPTQAHREFNFGMLDLGALVCRYSDPLCEQCPLNALCDYYNQNRNKLIKEVPGRYDTSVGGKLRSLRKDKGVTLVNLAQSSGVSKLTIIRIEAGRSTPKIETIRKLASALQVSPGALQ